MNGYTQTFKKSQWGIPQFFKHPCVLFRNWYIVKVWVQLVVDCIIEGYSIVSFSCVPLFRFVFYIIFTTEFHLSMVICSLMLLYDFS